MDPELEAYVARAQDPTLIPGIYNYCHHRCERCPFTTRCFSYREEQAQVRGGADHLADHVEANFRRTAALMRGWSEQHGIDLEDLQDIARPEDVELEPKRADQTVDRDPLQLAAWQYFDEAYDIVEPLRTLSVFHAWPSAVGAAIDTIAWHSGMIPAKVGRALHGLACRGGHADDDPVQNDWNGSAKVARLAIAESLGAWNTLFAAGQTPSDASIRQIARLLERIDRGLDERFPLAMDFVRPGFDEPDVAAGAPAKPPFEPSREFVGGRLRAWLSRLWRRWRRRETQAYKKKARSFF